MNCFQINLLFFGVSLEDRYHNYFVSYMHKDTCTIPKVGKKNALQAPAQCANCQPGMYEWLRIFNQTEG